MTLRFGFVIFISLLLFTFTDFSNLYAQKKVLFIGNSFTAGVPSLVQEIAESAGEEIVAEASWAGQTLQEQANSDMTYQTIYSKDWDYIVLQEQSSRSRISLASFKTNAEDAIKKIRDSAMANNNSTQMMGYMIWGSLNGERGIPPSVNSLPQWYQVRENYLWLAEELDGICSPAGMAWLHLTH